MFEDEDDYLDNALEADDTSEDDDVEEDLQEEYIPENPINRQPEAIVNRQQEVIVADRQPDIVLLQEDIVNRQPRAILNRPEAPRIYFPQDALIVDHEEEVVEEPEDLAPAEFPLVVDNAEATEDDDISSDEDPLDDMLVLQPDAFDVAYEEVVGTADEQPKIWYMPSLPFNTIVAVAIFNSENSEMTKADIFDFITEHFPYYNNRNFNEQWIYLKCTYFYRSDVMRNGEPVFKMGHRNKEAAKKALSNIWQKFPDLHSRFYSMKNPELWPSMVYGRYRHGAALALEYRPQIHMRPAFTEKILLGIAMVSLKNRGVSMLEVFSFIEYYFPALQRDKKWKEVAYQRLKTPVEKQGMFMPCKDEGRLLFSVADSKGNEIVEAVEKFVRERRGHNPAPVSGLRDPELWDKMLEAKLEYEDVPAWLIEKVRNEIRPIEEAASQDPRFKNLPAVTELQRRHAHNQILRKLNGDQGPMYYGGPIRMADGRVVRTMYEVYKPEIHDSLRYNALQRPAKK